MSLFTYVGLFWQRAKSGAGNSPFTTLVTPVSLDMHISLFTYMVLAGESGAGKSSLLRAIAGLWTTGEHVKRDIYFRKETYERHLQKFIRQNILMLLCATAGFRCTGENVK